MKQILNLTLSLTIIAMVATALLSIVNDMTEGPIAKAEAVQQASALKAILPDFDNDPFQGKKKIEVQGGEFQLLTATQSGKVVGYAILGFTDKGFSGRIEAMVGFKPNGEITKVMVTKHAETPGLGTKVCDRKVQKTIKTILSGEKQTGLAPSIFLDQYDGVSAKKAATVKLKEVLVEKGGKKSTLDAISGATVSSTAMSDAVNRICTEFIKFQKEK
jgi:electron transport complex protein RnfG